VNLTKKCVFAEKVWIFFTSRFAGGGSRQFNHFHAELTARADSQAAGAANSIVSLQNWPQARFAGGGSHQFNHFLAELTARADLFVPNGTHGKKRGVLVLSKSAC